MATKLVDLADLKVKLALAGSRLREALGEVQEMTQNVRFMNALEEHELCNLQDTYRRLSTELDYVDEVFMNTDKRVKRATRKAKVTHA